MSDPHPEIGTGLAGIPATTKGGSLLGVIIFRKADCTLTGVIWEKLT